MQQQVQSHLIFLFLVKRHFRPLFLSSIVRVGQLIFDETTCSVPKAKTKQSWNVSQHRHPQLLTAQPTRILKMKLWDDPREWLLNSPFLGWLRKLVSFCRTRKFISLSLVTVVDVVLAAVVVVNAAACTCGTRGQKLPYCDLTGFLMNKSITIGAYVDSIPCVDDSIVWQMALELNIYTYTDKNMRKTIQTMMMHGLKMGRPRSLFPLFSLFRTIYIINTVDFSRIQTRIGWVGGEHTDHLITG